MVLDELGGRPGPVRSLELETRLVMRASTAPPGAALRGGTRGARRAR